MSDMTGEFSTTLENSQELRHEALTKQEALKRQQKPNFLFFWLVFTGLAWGAPIILSLYLPICLIELFFPKASSPRVYLRQFRKRIFSGGIFLYLKMQIWFRPEFDLSELRKLERSGERFLLISNHRSDLDVFLYISQIDGLQLLAKKALFYVPVLGIMMRITRQIPAEKKDFHSLEKAVTLIRKRIEEGEKVLIFPEFTRCKAGLRGINNFSLLPFQIAMKEKVKILILVVTGTDDIWPRGSLALKDSPTKLKVSALAPLDSTQFESVMALRNRAQLLASQKLNEEFATL